jgi:hypothetical protein
MYPSNKTREPALKTLWEKEHFSYMAILYCDTNGDIDYLPIKTDNTILYVDQKYWPNIDRVPFNSLEQLLEALESNGFKQVPGQLDSIEIPWSSYKDLPKSLQEQLTEPGMFMLDRDYHFRFQFEPFTPGPVAFGMRLDGDAVYIDARLVSAMNETRYDNVDALLKELSNHGDEARILDWAVNNHSVRTPELNFTS